MKKIASIISCLLLALTTQAAMVDNFESYSIGSITAPWVVTDGSPIFDEEAGGNMYTESYGSYRGLAGASISNSDTETTVFYRIYKPAGTSPDCSVGLSDLTDPTGDWNDFETYVTIVSGELRARNGGGNETIVGTMYDATWYNLWLVINNSADTYDVYVTTGSSNATIGDRVADDFSFRNGGSNDLTSFKVYGRGTGYGPIRVDDIYVSSGTDLTIPSGGFTPPVIISGPSDIDANETQTAVFTTIFTSQTTPTDSWYKVASPADIAMDPYEPNIDIQLSYDSQSEEYTSTLTITDLGTSDSGQYYCQINNSSNSPQNSNTANLMVYGIVAHWTLDQNRYIDSNYLDEIGGCHAAATGSPTFVTGANGVANKAVQVTATDGWALCPLMDPVKQSGQLTISFWANWSETPGSQQDLQAESTQSELLQMTNGLKADGQWQHICTVFDESIGKLYVDGVLVDQGSWTLPGDTDAAINLGITIDETNSFNGAMDDVKLFNYALSDTEVADLRYDLSGERSCILAYDSSYDLTGPEGQPDCIIDLYDLGGFADEWLTSYDLTEFADLASSWQSSGLYPAGN
jgi:hypothetical protein